MLSYLDTGDRTSPAAKRTEWSCNYAADDGWVLVWAHCSTLRTKCSCCSGICLHGDGTGIRRRDPYSWTDCLDALWRPADMIHTVRSLSCAYCLEFRKPLSQTKTISKEQNKMMVNCYVHWFDSCVYVKFSNSNFQLTRCLSSLQFPMRTPGEYDFSIFPPVTCAIIYFS